MSTITYANVCATFSGSSRTGTNPSIPTFFPESEALPSGQLLQHVLAFAHLVDEGKCKATLATMQSFLNEHAFAGRPDAKTPGARAFAHWVKIVRTLTIVTADNMEAVCCIPSLVLMRVHEACPSTDMEPHGTVVSAAANDNFVAS